MGVESEGRMHSSSLEHARSSSVHGRKASIEEGSLGESPRDLEAKLNRGLIENIKNQEVRNFFKRKGFEIESPDDLINATIANYLIEDKHFLDGYTPLQDEFIKERPDFVLRFRSEEGEEPDYLAFKIVEGQPGIDQDLELEKMREVKDCYGKELDLFEITVDGHWQEIAILLAKQVGGKKQEKNALRELETIESLREQIGGKSGRTAEDVVNDISKKLVH